MAQTANAILARNMLRLRKQRSWSQEECAERCGLHRTYVGAIERGERNVTLDTVDSLARAFGVSVASLLEEQRDA